MTPALALAVALAAGPETPETYAVERGDTCAKIARKFFGSEKRVDLVHQYNEFGPPPHNLEVGRVLRLRPAPPGPPSAEATLTFLKPSVRARKHLVDWVPATLEMSLFRNDEVSTLRGAGAEVTFRDRSWLLMEQNALIVIYGEAPRGKEPGGIGLVDGELRLAMASLRNPRAVSLPSATLVARSAVGVVSTDQARTARVALFEGEGDVTAQGKKVLVPRNHGTRVLDGSPPEPPRPLPAAPVLAGPSVLVVPASSEGARLTLAWGAAARAARYRVQLAADERFVERDRDDLVTALALDCGVLSRERSWARVIAYDEVDLQSAPSAVRQVVVVKLPGTVDGQARVLARGTPLELAVPAGLELVADGAPVTPPVRLAVGAHRVAMRSGAEVLFEQDVLVPPAPPALTLSGAARRTLRLRFDDPLSDADAPTLSGPGGALALSRVDERTFDAQVEVAGSHLVSWRGRELIKVEVP